MKLMKSTIRPASFWILFPGFLALLSATCTLAQNRPHWAYPSIEDSISVRDGKSGDRLFWPEFIRRLTEADVVFLGETHDDDTTHRLQEAVYAALLETRGKKVILAMEMFERDMQSTLDDYLQGKIDEKLFLEKARPWGNYREAYRPLVELAKSHGQPVVAANFPRPLRMKLMQTGAKNLDGLGVDRQFAPDQLLPNSPAYWKRADNATRSHSMFMQVETDEQSRLISTQSLWDNSMGEACVKALDSNPGYQVLHVNGGFHTEYWDGTAAQVRQRKPEAKIMTVAIRPAQNPVSAQMIGAPVADFVVFVEERAKNLNEDDWKVVVGRDNSYQFHCPEWATAERPAPLLIWLSDDGLSARDNLAYWKSAIGDQVAIAVIEPIHRQQESNLSISGRWFWLDRFPHDIGHSQQTVERAWQYLINRFPVDAGRVCLAGEGTGATVAAATALLTSRMEMQAIAFQPRQYAKLKDFPLPLSEDWGDVTPPNRSLTVLGNDLDKAWWNAELEAYNGVGIKAQWRQLDNNPWTRVESKRTAILESLGLKSEFQSLPDAQRKVLAARFGSPLEMHWLQMLAERKQDAQMQVAVVRPNEKMDSADVEKIDYKIGLNQVKAGMIPLCPGSFGGTTVLVLNEDQLGDLEAWMQLEANDPLTLRSRFNRTRIAVADGTSLPKGREDLELSAVLKKLSSENRKNLLIVPAEFCADESLMGQLSRSVKDYGDHMTIQWLPGLGGETPRTH
jgi:uncharacterized iron-regulated protein